MNKSRCLVIGERRGTYPGMKTSLKLNIIFVEAHETCGDAYPIIYEGEKIIVDFSEKNGILLESDYSMPD